MSINHAILGILSCEPMTGYDLKKIMRDSSFMPWSGNSNQVYKALLALAESGYVVGETLHQEEHSSSKKVYTVTDAGRNELKRWVQSAPDEWEMKKPFLIQFAWTHLLSKREVERMLDQYEEELRGRSLIEQKKAESGFFHRGRTPRETAVWQLLSENVRMSYQTELEWIDRARSTLAQYDDMLADEEASNIEKEGENAMYQVIEKNNQRYVSFTGGETLIHTEKEAMELFIACIENDVNRLLIHDDVLADEFFRLRTGIAGAVLQKFSTYGIKAAIVLDSRRLEGRFGEFMGESNRGSVFRSFDTVDAAEKWLLAGE